MIGHTVAFPALMGAFCTLTLAFGLTYHRRARQSSRHSDVIKILGRLRPVHSVTLQAARPSEQEETAFDLYDADELFDDLGGLEGMEALTANCAVLIDLACYVQRWYPEALPVAEQLRLNAREIDWHLDRLRGAALRGHLRSAFPDYARRAVALYCGMTHHVLELYRVTQVPGWTELQSAL